jgi:hypothetical protein
MQYLDISVFNILSREEQVSYLYDQCTFLAQRKESAQIRINLYSAGNFFVELGYNTLTHQLGQVRSFKQTDRLEPYLQKLSFPALFEV